MSVVHAIVGAPMPDGATFVAKLDGGGPMRVAVADDDAMTSPVFTPSQTVDAQGVAKVSITGLPSATQHWWQVEDGDTLDTSVTGRFRTLPAAGQPVSFTIAASGDAGAGDSGFVTDRVSNHPVFDTIREFDPLLFLHLGDYHYRDIGDGDHTPAPFDETDYRNAMDDLLDQPRQAQLYREVPVVPTWDNHDYGFTTGSATDSDGTLPHKAAARAVFQERWPHYPLGAGSGNVPIYYSFQIGRVLFVMLDVRSDRSPNSDPDNSSKTMLGATQKAWLDSLLSTSTASALCAISAGQWITVPTESDTWAAYETERAELVAMFRDRGWLHRMFMITASKHALGLDSGTGNVNGGFPVALFAALDAGGAGVQHNLYDQGPTQPGQGQWGTVQVSDLGSSILVTLTGRDTSGEWGSISFGFAAEDVGTEGVATVSELAPIVSGSHRMVVEARLLTTFQSGDDPAGEDLPILAGDVTLDGTAQVRGSLELETLGIDPDTGRSRFPRRASDLLAPYGNEVFVRRGVDAGDQILWSPLGYFRIESAEQDGHSESPMRLSGQDRMGGIIEATLLRPREYSASTPVAAVFADLIGDVHPDVAVVFDDDSGFADIGRVLVVDESRYDPLREIADGLGKIFYVDGEGLFRVESAPEDDDVAWEVRSGRDGVLLSSTRRVTREGAFNAVLATGEGADQDEPVSGVAIDNGPNSPTRWGGRFGRVPIRISSPTIRTTSQAQQAAREKLRRNLGAPHSADFSAVPNPALRPHHVVRVTARDGNRDVHVVESVVIPLVADGELSATTRERTHVVIGAEVS